MNPTGLALSCSHTNVKKFYCWQFVCLTLQVRLCNCHRSRFTSTPLLRLVEHVITGVWVLDLVTIRGWTNNNSQQPLSGILKVFTVYIDAILIGCVRIGYVRDTATTLFVYFRILLYFIYTVIYIYRYTRCTDSRPFTVTLLVRLWLPEFCRMQNHWWSSHLLTG